MKQLAALQHKSLVLERLRSRAEVLGVAGCHLWTGAKVKGYGYMKVPKTRQMEYTHRLMWIATNGPISSGLFVCHRCDTPLCINPEHLFLGSAKDNTRDMMLKGRARPGNQRPKMLRPPKPKREPVLSGDALAEAFRMLDGGARQVDVAAHFGVSQSLVSLHLVRRRRQQSDDQLLDRLGRKGSGSVACGCAVDNRTYDGAGGVEATYAEVAELVSKSS